MLTSATTCGTATYGQSYRSEAYLSSGWIIYGGLVILYILMKSFLWKLSRPRQPRDVRTRAEKARIESNKRGEADRGEV